MAEITEKALKIYKSLCGFLDTAEFSYKKDDDELRVDLKTRSDDLDINMRIFVDAESDMLICLSTLPFTMPEDKLIEGAIAINAINYALDDGSFVYDIEDGTIIYKMTNNFADFYPSEDIFAYAVFISCQVIDDYNDKLFLLSINRMTIEEFLNEISNN